MSTTHINANKEDIAKTVIMPGDPLRAKFIAETYLKDYKLINSVRNMLGYTGYYKDKRITVMSSGMGNPSMGIYSYELFNYYNVDNIIRVGTCGSYNKDIKIFDLILVDKSYSNSTYALNLNNYKDNNIESSTILNNIIEQTSKENNINIIKGNIHNTDTFY
ncbi:MAG TPA: purine nucleoside phosphorylase DeoD-type, partial [Bacilli bacterium]|nr:purine nucleoside phosphorylase DeoD-type [Bacilli bacterium]